jgi:methionyl-tRNA formyltransferase
MRVVFAGTPEPAVAPLRALLASSHEVVAVVTRPDAPAGRGRNLVASPVADLAAEHGIATLKPVRADDPEFLAALTELAPDACPVVAYGALLKKAALDIPALGWINLHFSVLPAWRGAAPVQHAILHGDTVTGATTFRLDEGMDTGPVLGVVTESIRPSDTSGDVLERLSVSGAGLLVATLDALEAGELAPVAQSLDGVSYAPKINADDARVNWAAPAFAVDRLIRATTPAPGAWTMFRDERLKVGPSKILDASELAPGQLRVTKNEVAVGTATFDIALGEVRPHGKKPMPAADWARGVRIDADEALA